MKYLFVFLFATLVHADPPVSIWWPVGSDAGNIFSTKDDCKRLGGGAVCVDATTCRPEVCSPDLNNVMQADGTKQAAVTADASDAAARAGKINQVKNVVKACVKNWGSLTAAQISACQLAAIKLSVLAD